MEREFTPDELKYIADCKANPKIVDWLSNFKENDRDRFLADYWKQRAVWNQFGARLARNAEDRITSAMQQAEMVLYYIQQKKLFDLQCLWRAGQVDVPGVQHSGDFLLMELKIKNLDIISPISGADVELLKDYVTDYRWSRNLYVHHGWQNYEAMVRDNEEVEEFGFPLFYRFVAERTKEPALWRLLPDKRGAIEWAYRDAGFKAKHPQEPITHEEVANLLDTRKSLYLYSNEEADFAKRFDDHLTNERRAAYRNYRELDEDEEFKYALDVLQHADEMVTVEGGVYWLDAVKQAAFRYQRTKVANALDVAFENYLFRRQMGISLPDEELGRGRWISGGPAFIANEILDGREAKGEPRDFNF